MHFNPEKIPDNWQVCNLEEKLESLIDYRGKTPPSSLTGIPALSARSVKMGEIDYSKVYYISKETYKKFMVRGFPKKGDVLMTTEAPLGCVAKLDRDDVCVAQRLLTLRGKQGQLDNDYLRYFLTSDYGQQELFSRATGSTVQGIKRSEFKKVNILLPDFVTQTRIAKILDDLDNKIENNRRMNATLEVIAQAIFKSWFVDFDPVKAKIAALEAGGSTEDALIAAMQAISGMNSDGLAILRTHNETAYVELKSTAEAFPSNFTESPLGLIPEAWRFSEIGNEIDTVGGGTPSTKEAEFWHDGSIHWTTPKDMSDLRDKVLINTERKITVAGLKKISSGLLPVDTVLMSSRAPVGYLAITKIPVAINQGYIAMKCNKLLTPEFVIQWCFHNMEEIKQRASGTTFAEISKKSFYPIPVIVPGDEVLRTYTNNVRSLYLKIEANVRENQSLTLIRDNLLPKLLSGEISVEDIESAEG